MCLLLQGCSIQQPSFGWLGPTVFGSGPTVSKQQRCKGPCRTWVPALAPLDLAGAHPLPFYSTSCGQPAATSTPGCLLEASQSLVRCGRGLGCNLPRQGLALHARTPQPVNPKPHYALCFATVLSNSLIANVRGSQLDSATQAAPMCKVSTERLMAATRSRQANGILHNT